MQKWGFLGKRNLDIRRLMVLYGRNLPLQGGFWSHGIRTLALWSRIDPCLIYSKVTYWVRTGRSRGRALDFLSWQSEHENLQSGDRQ